MIHEEICTYEVCKLAKKKGFPQDYQSWTGDLYDKNGGLCFSTDSEFCVAPTQSLLQKWLREEKGIHIAVFPNMANSFEFDYIVYIKGDKFWNPIYTAHNDFATYELALEYAIAYSLKNLV